MIVLDHTPICPLCSDALEPSNISSLLGVVFCGECATRARSAHWPEPYDFGHVFAQRDLMWACGLRWYHPHDHSQETAFSRHEREESQALDAERFRLSRLNGGSVRTALDHAAAELMAELAAPAAAKIAQLESQVSELRTELDDIEDR